MLYLIPPFVLVHVPISVFAIVVPCYRKVSYTLPGFLPDLYISISVLTMFLPLLTCEIYNIVPDSRDLQFLCNPFMK